MSFALFVFSIGVFAVGLLPGLPSLYLLIAIAPVALLCLRVSRTRSLFFLFTGVCWGVGYGWQMQAHQLPNEDEGETFVVRGQVVGLPAGNESQRRFILSVESAKRATDGNTLPLQKLQLGWYQSPPDIKPGQIWRLTVSLRRPRGFANAGGFDYRLWLLRRGISATGYVRNQAGNTLLATRGQWSDSARFALRSAIEQVPASDRSRALLKALTIGDSGEVNASDWQLLNRTGTTHLLVISGLHVGLFSWVCYWLGAGLGRLTMFWWPQLPARYVAALLALTGSLLYANLAGFGLPAVRAVIMVAVVLATQYLRTRVNVFSGVSIALAAIAVSDPLAIHASGFWLSFVAVVALLSVLAYRRGAMPWWQKLWLPQWTVFVALPGFLLSGFGRLSLLSPLTNALAIPWISLLIVPVCLIGVVALPLSPVIADWCWQIAATQLDGLWAVLSWAGGWTQSLEISGRSSMSPVWLASVLFGGLLLLLPRGLPGRWLGCLPLLAFVLAEPQNPQLTVTILDVGQGLAVVVRTRHHTLVYDTGARFSDRFDAGSGIIAPYLSASGITEIDRVIVSHRDGDHAGGLPGLLSLVAAGDVMASEPVGNGNVADSECRGGAKWRWDDVDFEVLSPVRSSQWHRNNRSCVLLVSAGKHRVLLPGDIESDIERWLASEGRLPDSVDVLVAPHHGSNTSSSPTFAWRLMPGHVVYSAGYRHPFGHPHPKVVARYRSIGSRQWNTADDGAIELVLRDGHWEGSGYRHHRMFYWQ